MTVRSWDDGVQKWEIKGGLRVGSAPKTATEITVYTKRDGGAFNFKKPVRTTELGH